MDRPAPILVNSIINMYIITCYIIPGLSSKLHKLDNWVSEDKKCTNRHIGFDGDRQLCVGDRSVPGKGTCFGDSGSAFLCKGTDSRFYQVLIKLNIDSD